MIWQECRQMVLLIVAVFSSKSLYFINFPHPGLAQILVWNKPQFCPLGNREVQSAEVSRVGCWYLQYCPNPVSYCLAKSTLLSVSKQIAAECRGVKVWLLRLVILTESSCAIYLPNPVLKRVLVWNKPHLCLLRKRELQSAEVSRAGFWDLKYWLSPRARPGGGKSLAQGLSQYFKSQKPDLDTSTLCNSLFRNRHKCGLFQTRICLRTGFGR